jgi:hypothetical protein
LKTTKREVVVVVVGVVLLVCNTALLLARLFVSQVFMGSVATCLVLVATWDILVWVA